jgi:hypothetical protein
VLYFVLVALGSPPKRPLLHFAAQMIERRRRWSRSQDNGQETFQPINGPIKMFISELLRGTIANTGLATRISQSKAIIKL